MKTTAIKRITGLIVVLVAAAVMMLALSACGPKEITVNIDDDGSVTEVTTEEGKTVADILEANAITLNEGDEVDPSLDTAIEGEDATITILRIKNVAIEVDGETVDVQLVSGTVQDALDEANIVLAEGDTVDIETITPLEDGMLITVTRAQIEEKKTSNQSSANTNKTDKSSKSNSNASDKVSSQSSTRTVVSRTKTPDCADPTHGYETITYSDGTVEYREY